MSLQAMGLSFSVPYNFAIPSSLQNIYKNLQKYGHIRKIPNHGNLSFWATQGCLLLNTSLTVYEGADNKNCHQSIWTKFTDNIIKYISDTNDYVVFVLWGAHAMSKCKFIDLDKHDAIISSHPSGLSADKPLSNYSSFNTYDHFGQINKLLQKHNKKPIIWQL